MFTGTGFSCIPFTWDDVHSRTCQVTEHARVVPSLHMSLWLTSRWLCLRPPRSAMPVHARKPLLSASLHARSAEGARYNAGAIGEIWRYLARSNRAKAQHLPNLPTPLSHPPAVCRWHHGCSLLYSSQHMLLCGAVYCISPNTCFCVMQSTLWLPSHVPV